MLLAYPGKLGRISTTLTLTDLGATDLVIEAATEREAATSAGAPDLARALWVTIVGYILQRLQEGFFIKRFGIEMHIWRRFDSLYRLVVARRNPNLALLSLFALAGRPADGLIAVAVWTAVSLVIHSVQIAQALRAPQPLKSWLAK